MVQGLFVEGEYSEEDIVYGIADGHELGDLRMDVDGDVEVREVEEGRIFLLEEERMSGTAFEENTDVIKVEIIVEERVI